MGALTGILKRGGRNGGEGECARGQGNSGEFPNGQATGNGAAMGEIRLGREGG